MAQEISWLADLGRTDVAVAGGKGANLGELVRGGFPVPDGFVVTTAAYDRFVAEHHLADAIADAAAAVTAGQPAGAAASRVADLFSGGALDPGLAEAIRDAYARLGGGPVAVRSSATAEDLAEASFAGQQDTYLNVVGDDALLAAVRDCWASLWADRAIWYRAQHGVGDASLAVVVQRLVPAEAAGVMFTANPANGRTEETVITAAWGLGEAVVSGLVDTDTIVVDTDGDRVLTTHVADKAVRIDPVVSDAPETAGSDRAAASGRTRTSPTGAERNRAVLDDAAALRLAALGERIAAHFGAPQDIEWTLAGGEFQLVQSRPITALPPRTGPIPVDWPVPQKGLYFRASITEQLPDPLTPLFADLMATAVPAGLNRMLAELVPGGASSDIGFPTINGYAFYRYSYSAFGALLKMTPMAIQKVLGGGGSWIEDRWRARLADYRAEVDAEAALEVGAVSASELLAAVERLVDAVTYYYTAVQTIIPLAATAELTWTGVYDKLLKRPGDPSAEVFLLGYDSEPIRADKALYDLARWVRDQPGLAEAVADPSVDALADDAPGGVSGEVWTQWRERVSQHLSEHGHTLYNLDFVNPVPADDPTPVLGALRYDLADDAPDPHVRQQRAAAAREDAAAALLVRLQGWRAERVRSLLTRAQHTGPLREDALAAMGLFLPPARRLLRALGDRLVAADAVAEPMDVCWLTLDEARGLAASLDGGGEVPGDLRDRIAARQAEARGERLATPPQYLPKNRTMDAFEWMYPATAGGAVGGVLTGTAGSGGVVTAPARVLSGPEDFGLFRPGEVLVASITTPAYTPLFAMAAGVVTNIGGVLSHGSIVAREYGIPAVLGTGSATRDIHTGDEITVDGSAGTVRLPGAVDAVEQPAPGHRWLLVAAGAALVAAAVAHVWYHARKRR
ncbi:MAG: PEP/pyruvate-binding domain-containing protein [Propionicimonas sp.]|uniref:PEP/pyruvate-binding domain-containing protein n=1 Tax=Propionicimonas sp. TaxID=1955623 RepID=UPI003D15065B